MNALELADQLQAGAEFPAYPVMPLTDAAAMLRRQNALIEELQKVMREFPNTQLQYADHIRRQHDAIQKLREALCMAKLHFVVGGCMYDKAEKALEDTEGFV